MNYFLSFSDVREDYCFDSAPGGVCQTPVHRDKPLQRMTKTECCCNMADAWGGVCERCPQHGTKQYDDLCGDYVVGLKPDGSGEGLVGSGQWRPQDGERCHLPRGLFYFLSL